MAWREEIWLKIGQSNSVGSNGVGGDEDVYPETIDAEHPRVFEMSRNVSTIGYPAVPQGELIPHRAQAQDNSNYGVGFAQTFGKVRADDYPSLDRIIIINAGVGATSFSGGHWVAGQSLALIAHDLLVEAMTNFPDAVFAGILWHQGENDIDQTQEWYEGQLSAMVDYIRGGAESVDPSRNVGVFLCGTMLEYYINLAGTRLRPIDDAHRNVTNYIENSALVDFIDLTGRRDTVHFNSQSLRTMGARYAAAAEEMITTLPEDNPTSSSISLDPEFAIRECAARKQIRVFERAETGSFTEFGDPVFKDTSRVLGCMLFKEIEHDTLGVGGNQATRDINERTTNAIMFIDEKLNIGDVVYKDTSSILDADNAESSKGYRVSSIVKVESPYTAKFYYKVSLS